MHMHLTHTPQGGWTPMMVAVWHGHAAIVEILQRAGADVNATNEAGVCALTLAVVKHPPLIRLLATSACQLNIQDKEVGRGWSYHSATVLSDKYRTYPCQEGYNRSRIPLGRDVLIYATF